jgi:hypothetical protein
MLYAFWGEWISFRIAQYTPEWLLGKVPDLKAHLDSGGGAYIDFDVCGQPS